tara:strand:- start:31140 stop:32765 length:1626 start_codon:yes stop_codon:yes gene_type:complete
MPITTIGGVEIFRPSTDTELKVRIQAESKLRNKYETGKYSDKDTINSFLQDYFLFYDQMLKALLPQISSIHLLDFVLHEYDQSCAIQRSKELNHAENAYWSENGPFIRRAIKYLAECIVMLTPEMLPSADSSDAKDILETCWICAEQLVDLSNRSTQTFVLFPDETTLEILPEDNPVWNDLYIQNYDRFISYNERIKTDTSKRKDFIEKDLIYNNSDRLNEYVDPVFMEIMGMTFTEIRNFIATLAHCQTPDPDESRSPFASFEELSKILMNEHFISSDQCMEIINGISLNKSNMLSEGRVVWKPKQEYRSYARFLFEVDHESTRYFLWSRGMVSEGLYALLFNTLQKKVPPEWSDPRIDRALGKYEQSSTSQFETIVVKQLNLKSIFADRFKSQIGIGETKLDIPKEIGDIDLIGYWEGEDLLIVGDAKLVKPTYEAAMHRDDIDKFILNKKNYVNQIKRKTTWVIKNIQNIITALESVGSFPTTIKVKRIAPLIVTYYPSFASCLIQDVPCVALTELISDITEHQSWPYSPVHEVGVNN